MMATIKQSLSCHPTPQRRRLATAVLVVVWSAAVVMIGVIHASGSRDTNPRASRSVQCAAETPAGSNNQ